MKQKFISICCVVIGIALCVGVFVLNIGKDGALRYSIIRLFPNLTIMRNNSYIYS